MTDVERATAFLLARLDEDDEAWGDGCEGDGEYSAVADLCDRYDAVRPALRKVVELHHEYLGVCAYCVDARGEHQREAWPCATIRALTAIWSAHPGYLDAMAAPTVP